MARRRTQPEFDPYAILGALEQERTTYIIVGAFARVLVGADEITRGVDLTPSTREENLRRASRSAAGCVPQSPHPPISHACSAPWAASKTAPT